MSAGGAGRSQSPGEAGLVREGEGRGPGEEGPVGAGPGLEHKGLVGAGRGRAQSNRAGGGRGLGRDQVGAGPGTGRRWAGPAGRVDRVSLGSEKQDLNSGLARGSGA